MTIKDEAKQLVDSFIPHVKWKMGQEDCLERAKKCALISVQKIINSNPHSNPFNTEVYSTMDYWLEVKTEVEKL